VRDRASTALSRCRPGSIGSEPRCPDLVAVAAASLVRAPPSPSRPTPSYYTQSLSLRSAAPAGRSSSCTAVLLGRPASVGPVNDSKRVKSPAERRKAMLRELRSHHPRFIEALLADAQLAAAFRGERHEFRSRLDGVLQALRLMLQTDAFLALAAYRLKARLQALGIPVLPWLAHRLAMISAQVAIADTAVVHPGVFIPNGQVVVYGVVEIHPGVRLLPWVTVGPIGGGVVGPRIGPGAQIGTGAKVMGDFEVGANARVGVNAVVLDDVPPETTVVGIPAQPVTE
jgi:serine O-acetyltransferase